MIYDRLPPQLKQFVDLIMAGHNNRSIGIAMSLTHSMTRHRAYSIARQYGIPANGPFQAKARLIYLRAKELGLIQ